MSDIQDENHLIEERKKKLKELKKNGINYPNSFRRSNLSMPLIEDYSEFSKEELSEKNISVSVAGSNFFSALISLLNKVISKRDKHMKIARLINLIFFFEFILIRLINNLQIKITLID